MSVYIASMNMRGKWAPAPPDSLILNVTSAQRKNSPDRLEFSPMTPVEGGYKGYWNFESYWQSGKVFDGISHEKSVGWWKNQDKPKRRYPGSRGLKCLYAEWPDTGRLNYIESRKYVYVPEYYNLIIDRPRTKYWVEKGEPKVAKGEPSRFSKSEIVTIYDFDGPRKSDGSPTIKLVTPELIEEKLNDPKFPFGHGYIVASIISGIDILDFC